MDWGKQFDRAFPALVAGVVVFALQTWDDNNQEISDRVAKAVTKTYIRETFGRRLSETQSIVRRNARINNRQDRLWARACDRMDMRCDLQNAALRHSQSLPTDEIPRRTPVRKLMYTSTACEIPEPVMPVPYKPSGPPRVAVFNKRRQRVARWDP